MAATAPKDNQNPAAVTAQGSATQTALAARANAPTGVTRLRQSQAAATAPSISTVR